MSTKFIVSPCYNVHSLLFLSSNGFYDFYWAAFYTFTRFVARPDRINSATNPRNVKSFSHLLDEIELTSSYLGLAFLRNGCSLLIVGNSMVCVVALLPSRQLAYSAAWQFLGKVRGRKVERPHESLSSRTTSIIREAARPCQPAP